MSGLHWAPGISREHFLLSEYEQLITRKIFLWQPLELKNLVRDIFLVHQEVHSYHVTHSHISISRKNAFVGAMTGSEQCILASLSCSIHLIVSSCTKLETENKIIQSVCPHAIYLSFLKECIKKTIQPIDFILIWNTVTKCDFPSSFIQAHHKCVWVFWKIILDIVASTMGKIQDISLYQEIFSSLSYRCIYWCREKRNKDQKGNNSDRNISTQFWGGENSYNMNLNDRTLSKYTGYLWVLIIYMVDAVTWQMAQSQYVSQWRKTTQNTRGCSTRVY